MTSVDFPQRNCELAKDQPEYETLFTHVAYKEMQVPVDGNDPESPLTTRNIPNSMTACFELSDEEIAEIVATRKIWHTQMVFGHPFQPILMSTQNPFN